jgi:hypothetical protein
VTCTEYMKVKCKHISYILQLRNIIPPCFSHYSSDSLSKLHITTDTICSKFCEAANPTVLQKYSSVLLNRLPAHFSDPLNGF